MGDAAEELWHVRFGPDEVKQLTLEQLDDLFRLDVISADTQIWQPGMDEWLPLSVVAGLGEEAPESANISVPPPPPSVRRVASTTQNVWPPPAAPASFRPPIAPGSLPPAPPRPRAVGSRPPPPPSSRPNAPLSSTVNSWPPAAAWSDPPPARAGVSGFAPTVAAGSTPFKPPVVAALAPPPVMFEDTAPRARRAGSGAWVVVLSVVVGLGVTLYRNDLVHAAAGSLGQSATVLKLESALGGPGFGTPRAVERMMTRPKVELESPPSPVTAPTTVATTAPTSASTSAAAEAPRAAAPTPEPPKAATPTAASKPPPASAAGTPVRGGAPASRSTGGVQDPDGVFKQPKKGKKGNEYDPLNPSL
jgi:hypothetical protein